MASSKSYVNSVLELYGLSFSHFCVFHVWKSAQILIDKYKFKLKGTGPISFHLGCEFVRDKEGVLCLRPRKYIDRMVATYVGFS